MHLITQEIELKNKFLGINLIQKFTMHIKKISLNVLSLSGTLQFILTSFKRKTTENIG